ncbi:MAG TPA: fibronectin type III domain-containing protein [Flavobacteriales bacterium]|nr:fibronectin type III domain-containing protein [Flavobacteriales bacterium]
MKSKVKLSLYLLNPAKRLMLLRNVIGKMSGNPHFPTPPVTMVAATALADELDTAIQEATHGSKAAKAVRNALSRQCADMLNVLADYQRMVSNGDEVMLSSGGFEMAKKRELVGIPGAPQKLQVRFTNAKGQLDLRWQPVRGAHGYQVWMTAMDPTVEAHWEAIGYTTRVSHLVDELESFKAHWFCVSAIGVAGEGLQSDPAMGRAA